MTAQRVSLDEISFIGHDLNRPECVIATSTGEILSADWRGGVAVTANGYSTFVRASGELPRDGIKPNGIALDGFGGVLIAHLSQTEGGVWRMKRDGSTEPWLVEVDGQPLPPTNFVHVDELGRTWITVSTRHVPRDPARSPKIADGYVVLVADGTPRVVADGLGFTNEAKVDPSGKWLYVNETFGRRLTRFRIRPSGLGGRETFAEFGEGVFPDGLEFDVHGGVWIVSIYSNRLIRVDASRRQRVFLDDFDAAFLAGVEEDFWSGGLVDRAQDLVPARRLRNVSSIAFGGHDRKTAFLGCLQGDRIATFPSPIAGVRPAHWDRTWQN